MNKKSKIYIVVTLAISWILTFALYYFKNLNGGIAYIMLVPALVALVMRIIFEGFTRNIYRNPKAKGVGNFFKAVLFAILYPMIIISICAFVGAVVYGQNIDGQFISKLFNYKFLFYFVILSLISPSIIFTLGEEYGWRAFLLVELCKTSSKVKASTIVGIVWALYHVPVMILLNISKVGLVKASMLALIQGAAAFIFSYAFSYCYFISNRLYPAIVMHGFWNILNPFVLGSIYEGEIGKVLTKGEIFMTNGEGIFGIIFGGVGAIIFVAFMRRKEAR